MSINRNKKNDQISLIINRSIDNGKTWSQSTLPIKEISWEKEVQKENVFVTIPLGDSPSWILLTSEPAAGQMGKTLYESNDNGKSWIFLGDFSQTIEGYVTGITFRTATDGWIAASHHSTILVPLYRAKDGSKTWSQ